MAGFGVPGRYRSGAPDAFRTSTSIRRHRAAPGHGTSQRHRPAGPRCTGSAKPVRPVLYLVHTSSTGHRPGARIGDHLLSESARRDRTTPRANIEPTSRGLGSRHRPVVGMLGSLVFLLAGHAAGAQVTPGTGTLKTSTCKSPVCSAALGADDREALGRLAYAKAGDQGEEGLTAVLYAVLNRLASGRFGSDVTAVIEAPGQFEPLDRAGGHWRNLPSLSARQRATIETIFGLIQQGRLPDPTHGATFFQNPRIVAAREAAGQVRVGLTNFNDRTPIAVIRDHAFFGQLGLSSAPAESVSPRGHLVYPPGAKPAFQVERINAGSPAHPHGVMYRIVPLPGIQAGAARVESERLP